jgi:hypothetical protein
MDSFFIVVLSIASIILIVSLATIGVAMQKGARGGTFPPVANGCPDGWTTTSSDRNTANEIQYVCTAPSGFTQTLTSGEGLTWASTAKTLSYNDSTTSICDRRKWTTKNNILWDGVSNYNSC